MNSKSTRILMVGGLSAVVIAVCLGLAADEETSEIGWFGAIFFGICGIFAIIKLSSSKNSGVQILDEGLLIMGTMVRWENITGFAETNGGILVFTNNVEERLAQASSLKKMNIKLSLKTSNTDLIVPTFYYKNANAFIDECKKHCQ